MTTNPDNHTPKSSGKNSQRVDAVTAANIIGYSTSTYGCDWSRGPLSSIVFMQLLISFINLTDPSN